MALQDHMVVLLLFLVVVVFLRNLHSILHSGCVNLHSTNNVEALLFSIPSPEFLVYTLFDDGHSNLWASLVAQLVKNPPAMQEIPVRFLGR